MVRASLDSKQIGGAAEGFGGGAAFLIFKSYKKNGKLFIIL